jgi:hypothetical protein
LSATTTISLIWISGSRRQANASKIARFGNELSKLFQVLLVFVVKAVLDSTIDIDDGDNLNEITISFNNPHTILRLSLLSSDTDSRSRSRGRQRGKNKKLTFPPCKIGTTISEALAASQAMCPGNFSTSATS